MSPFESSTILCLGLTPCLQRTLCFKDLRSGEVNRAVDVIETASGKATNVARVIKTMGGAVQLLGFSGGDTGQRMQALLHEEGLAGRWVTTANPTRICQTLIDETSGEVTELVEESAAPAAEELRALQGRLSECLEPADWLVLSGRLSPGSPVTLYRECVQMAHAAKCRVILDSQREPLLEALSAEPWLVKLNRDELGWTLGRSLESDASMRDAAQELLKRGARNVIVTQGAESVFWCTDQEGLVLSPPSIQAINPIGSGDALAAGIAVGMLRGQSLSEAVRLGLACGAANALTFTPGGVDPHTVQTLLNQMS